MLGVIYRTTMTLHILLYSWFIYSHRFSSTCIWYPKLTDKKYYLINCNHIMNYSLLKSTTFYK